MGTRDISTYLAERLGQGISALCGRMGAKNISTHYVGGCREEYISTHCVKDGTMEYKISLGRRI
jgi:hypothetical protein